MKYIEKLKFNDSLSRRNFLKVATNKGIGTLLGLSVLVDSNCKFNSTEMPNRVLGRTKLSVSLLGFGCTQVKDKKVYQHAIELGINYFHMGDRDPTYNLDACAALLPYRKKIIIAYMSYPKASRTQLLDDLDNYLKQSGFGYLDVWFVITPRPEVLNAFHEAISIAYQAGKIRWSGITTHSLDRDVKILTTQDSKVDVVMMAYNYLSPPAHSDILGKFHHANLGITPMKPLAGKFYQRTINKPDPLLRWLADDTRIHTIPVIMNTIEQVDQNVAAVKLPISQEDLDVLQTLYVYNSQRYCRMCGACNGKCPKQLSVSDLVRTAMYSEGYKDIELARSNFLSIPKNNRKISCETCDQCLVICPNGVAIKERICGVKELLV